MPLAGYAETHNGELTLTGMLASPDGKEFLKQKKNGAVKDCETIGIALAEELLSAGGRNILSEVGIDVS